MVSKESCPTRKHLLHGGLPPRPWWPSGISSHSNLSLMAHINGIIKCTTFCVWLLPLGMFLRCIHSIARISAAFLFRTEVTGHCMDRPHLDYSVITWRMFGWVPHFGCIANSAMYICTQVFEYMFSTLCIDTKNVPQTMYLRVDCWVIQLFYV